MPREESEKFLFWSSGILTGNQTLINSIMTVPRFWSSGILTGNQTAVASSVPGMGFGAVAF